MISLLSWQYLVNSSQAEDTENAVKPRKLREPKVRFIVTRPTLGGKRAVPLCILVLFDLIPQVIGSRYAGVLPLGTVGILKQAQEAYEADIGRNLSR